MAIKRILCCCGGGIGTSMIEKMNVERCLKKIGITGVEVSQLSLSESNESMCDLIITGKDLFPQVEKWNCKKFYLNNLMDMNEIETKLREAF